MQTGHQADTLDVVDRETGLSAADRLGGLDRHLATFEDLHTLRPLLDALPERERTMVVLRFFGEMTQTQIAQQVGLSQVHVSRLLARTLTQLRAGLDGAVGQADSS